MPESLEEKTVIWLAGLVSTDGSVIQRKNRKITYVIYSAEKEWLERIRIELAKAGIKSKVSDTRAPSNVCYILNIHNPRKITKLFRKYAENWMINRKYRIILQASYRIIGGKHSKSAKFLRRKLHQFLQYLYDSVLYDEQLGRLDFDKIIDDFLRKKT